MVGRDSEGLDVKGGFGREAFGAGKGRLLVSGLEDGNPSIVQIFDSVSASAL